MQTTLARLQQIFIRTLACALPALALAACSSSSDDSGPVTTANAGADQSVLENTVVTLAGSGTSAGGTLTYVWSQTGGQTVTINNANMAVANFMAPDVTLGAPENLTFQLSVSDGTTLDVDSVVVTVQEPQPVVTVSGIVSYEFVPPLANCSQLDFNSIQTRPIRGATVQLLDANNLTNVLQTTTASNTGAYSFPNVDANSMVRVRVRAELKQSAGFPNWDVEVRDNFIAGASDTDIPPPPPQGTRALYVLDGSDFDTGGVDVVHSPIATTGWDGASYSGTRAAAPFAILDSIYSGIQFVLTAHPTAIFAPMDAFWSVNNTIGTTFDVTAGQMPTSFYSSGADSLYLLGDASRDTEEFDDHVIMHEWGHYFEDNFSRSDSIGGPHSLGESLDARLAWGEGFATAFGAMTLNDPLYCDTGPAGSPGGFALNVESDGFGFAGWYNEVSVATLLYDLWDSTNDGTDNMSLGFGPIFDTMVGPHRVTPAFATIHSFAAELRPMLDATQAAFLDSQLLRESVNEPNPGSVDIWASTESNDRAGARDALPLYTDYTADGSTINICVNNDLDSDVGGNKLAEYRYLRLTIPATDTYNVAIAATTIPTPTADPNDRDYSDPDMYIQRDGNIVAFGLSPSDGLNGTVINEENFTTQSTLFAGSTYVADIHDWRFEDFDVGGAPPGYPDTPNSDMCFDITMTATP